MGKASKDKGYRGESEFAKLVGGHRVPLSGAQAGYANDVILPNGWGAECKWRKNADGFKTLYEWLLDEREKPDIVALRADRRPFIVAMQLPKFMELMHKAMEYDRHVQEGTIPATASAEGIVKPDGE